MWNLHQKKSEPNLLLFITGHVIVWLLWVLKGVQSLLGCIILFCLCTFGKCQYDDSGDLRHVCKTPKMNTDSKLYVNVIKLRPLIDMFSAIWIQSWCSHLIWLRPLLVLSSNVCLGLFFRAYGWNFACIFTGAVHATHCALLLSFIKTCPIIFGEEYLSQSSILYDFINSSSVGWRDLFSVLCLGSRWENKIFCWMVASILWI